MRASRDLQLRAAGLFALVCGGLLILWAGRGTVFREDEWAFVTTRLGGDANAYLEPHNEHLLLLPVAVFKALFSVVGLGDYWAYRLVLIVVHLVCVVLLFVIVERRRGPAVGALAAVPVLLLGPAWEVLLFPIDIGFAGSMAAGLGVMLALDARSARGDLVACLLLLVALSSSGLGISIALGALVEVMWKPDRWRRLWVAAVPFALYAVWYLTYNLPPTRQGPLEYLEAPTFTVRVAGAAVAALLGIPKFETAGTRLDPWGIRLAIALLLVGVGALLWLVVVRRRLTPRVAMLMTALGSYWGFIGVSRAYTGTPSTPRYIYAGVVLMLLLAVEVTRGMAMPRWVLAGLAIVATGATLLNVHWLEWNGDRLRLESELVRAELGALEIARGTVPGDFRPIPRPAYPMVASGYFAAVDKLRGSVATPPQQLPTAPVRARVAADALLIRGTVSRVADTPATRRFLEAAGGDPSGERCVEVKPLSGRPAITTVAIAGGGLGLKPGLDRSISVRLRRFAPDFSDPSSAVPPVRGDPQLLLTPLGHSSTPWHARLSSTGAFQVC